MKEVDEQAIAVAGDSRRRERAFLVSLFLKLAPMNFGLPELFTGPAVEAENRLDLAIVVGRREKHLVADDRRRAVSAPRNIGFPDDVFRRAPFEWRLLVG